MKDKELRDDCAIFEGKTLAKFSQINNRLDRLEGALYYEPSRIGAVERDLGKLVNHLGLEKYKEPPKSGFRKIKKAKK